MASAEVNISGSDVVEALTQYNYDECRTTLNRHGEELADLIAERMFAKLMEKLGTKESQ